MRKILLSMLVVIICISLLSGCNKGLHENNGLQSTKDITSECKHNWGRTENFNEFTAVDKCSICGVTRMYTAPNKPNDIVVGMKGTRVWDWNHPDDAERNPEWSIKFASMPDVEFKNVNSSIYANNELLIGGPGYACMSFYTAKGTGTDKIFLCFGMSWGSGFCDERIIIMDFETKQEIFTLIDRMNHDYQLFVRDGILCVREMEHLGNEITRTGIIYYTGTNIQIVWDDSIIPDEDRNQVQNGHPVS